VASPNGSEHHRWLPRTDAAADAASPTAREVEVLAPVAEGLTNAQIARRLRVSDDSVTFHLQNLHLKPGLRNRTEAAAWFLRERRGGRVPGRSRRAR
jgi:DNA-binding NarL/FixJ family response regulator